MSKCPVNGQTPPKRETKKCCIRKNAVDLDLEFEVSESRRNFTIRFADGFNELDSQLFAKYHLNLNS